MAAASRRLLDRLDPVRLARICLVACLAITPAIFDLGAVKPFDIVKITTVLFFGWLAFGLWLAAVATGRSRIRRTPSVLLAGGYLAVSTVATVFSPTKATSLIGWYGRHHGLLTILIYVLIFWVVASIYREHPDRVHELLYGMAVGAVLMTVYVLMQRFDLDPISWVRPSGEVPGQRYFGTMGNANFAGGYLGLTAPWYYLAWRRSRATWVRVALVGWGVVTLYAIWLTSARNGMVALGAAIGTFLFIERRRIPLLVKLGAAVVALATLVLAVVIIWHPGSDRPPSAFRGADVFRSQTIEVRGYWWMAGLRMFADRPVVGWGPETFVSIYPRYLDRDAAALGDAETADKPHNVFVEHLAHTGILGFAAYIGLLGLVSVRAFRRLRIAGSRERPVLVAFITLLAGYVGQAFFSIDVTAIGLVGWVAVGALAALSDPPDRTEDPPVRRQRSTSRRVLAAVAVVVGVLLAGASTAPLKADHESRTAQRMGNADDFIDDVMAHHERSFRWNPLVPQYRALAGAYLDGQAEATSDRDLKREYFARALAQLERTVEIHPDFHGWKMALGRAIGDLASVGGASFDEALGQLDAARELAPYDWRVLVARADVYNQRATVEREPEDLCLALADYVSALELRPGTAEAWTGVGRTLARLGQLEESLEALQRAARLDEASDLPDRLAEEVRKIQAKEEPPEVQECGRGVPSEPRARRAPGG